MDKPVIRFADGRKEIQQIQFSTTEVSIEQSQDEVLNKVIK